MGISTFVILSVLVFSTASGSSLVKVKPKEEILRTYVTVYATAPNPGNIIIACKSGDDNLDELLLTNGRTDFLSFSFTGNSWTHFWCDSKMTDGDFRLYKMHTPIFNEGGPDHGGAWLFNQTGSGMLHEGWTFRVNWEEV